MNKIKEVAEFIGNLNEKFYGKNPYKITKEEYDNHDHKEEGCQGCAEWFEQNPKEENLSDSESRMERSDEVSRENAEAIN